MKESFNIIHVFAYIYTTILVRIYDRKFYIYYPCFCLYIYIYVWSTVSAIYELFCCKVCTLIFFFFFSKDNDTKNLIQTFVEKN